MRSIKQKLLVRILAMTAAAALICGGVGIAANNISSHSMLEQSLESTASLAATRVSLRAVVLSKLRFAAWVWFQSSATAPFPSLKRSGL